MTDQEQKQEQPSQILPPFPQALYPLTEDEEKLWAGVVDSDDPTEQRKTVAKKLFALWTLYGQIVNCEPLVELINKPTEDKTSDLFLAKGFIVQIVDQVSKVLSRGHILRELQTLQNEQ